MGDKVLPFAGYWLFNGITLFIFSLIWPRFVVFGNANINTVAAIIWTGFILTVVISLVAPIQDQLKIKVKNEVYMGLVYLVVNVVALWILARWLQPVTGLGIGAFYVAIVVGIVTNFAQYGFWKFALGKTAKKKV